MSLLTSHKEQFLKWINEKWQGEKKCPVCKENNWIITNDIFEMYKSWGTNRIKIGGERYPVIGLVCNNCGYTLFFNPLIVGLPMSNKEEKENE